MNDFNTKQRFSIRKYHIGAASVLLGAFIGLNTTSAQAAEEKVAQPVTESNITVAQPAQTTVAATPVEAQPAAATSAVPGATAESTVAPAVAEPVIAESVKLPTGYEVEAEKVQPGYKSEAKIEVGDKFKTALLERERIMMDIPQSQKGKISAYIVSGSDIDTNLTHKANHQELQKLGKEEYQKNTYTNNSEVDKKNLVNLWNMTDLQKQEINSFSIDLLNQLRYQFKKDGQLGSQLLVPAKGMLDYANYVADNDKRDFGTSGSGIGAYNKNLQSEAVDKFGIKSTPNPNGTETKGGQQDIRRIDNRLEHSGFTAADQTLNIPISDDLITRLKALDESTRHKYGLPYSKEDVDRFNKTNDLWMPRPENIVGNDEVKQLVTDLWNRQPEVTMAKLKEMVYEGIKKLVFTSGEDFFTNNITVEGVVYPNHKRYWELSLTTVGQYYRESMAYGAVVPIARKVEWLRTEDKPGTYGKNNTSAYYFYLQTNYTGAIDAPNNTEGEEHNRVKDLALFSTTPVVYKQPKDIVETIYKDNGDGGLNAFIKTTKADGTTTEVADVPNNKEKSTVKVDVVAKTVKYEADTASQSPAGTETSRKSGKDGYTEKTTTWSLDAQGQPKENVSDRIVEMEQDVVKISTKSDVEKIPLPKKTEHKEAPTKEFGYRETTTKGSEGLLVKTTTYTLKTDGTVEKNPVQEERTEPVNEVIEVGTKPTERPETVAKGTKYEANPALEANKQNVKTAGKDGSKVFVTEYDFNAKTGEVTKKAEVLKAGSEVAAEDQVIEVGTKPTERTVTVTKGTKYEANPALEANKQNVKTAGKDGSKVFVTEYDFNAKTGEVTKKAEVLKAGSEVAAEDQVIEVGTKPTERTETITRPVRYVVNPKLTTDSKVLVEGKDGVEKYETTYTLDTTKGIAVANPEVLISKEDTEEKVVELKLEEREVAPLPGGKQLTWVKKVGPLDGGPLEKPSHRDLTDDEIRSLMKPKDNTLLPGGKLSIDDQLRLLMIPKGDPILPGGKTPSKGKGEGQYVNLPTLDPGLLVPQPPVQGPGNGDNGVTPPSNNNGGDNGQVTPPSQGNYSEFNQPGKPLRNTGIVLPGVTGGQPANHKFNGGFEAPVSSKSSANALPKTSATTTNSASLPAGLAAALAAAGLLAAKRRKED